MLKTCTLQFDVEYDDEATDPERLRLEFDTLLGTALETPGVQEDLDPCFSEEHGTPGAGPLTVAKPLNDVLLALVSVADVIEATYGHDEDGERIPNEPGDASAADIVEMLCNVEGAVSDGWPKDAE